MNNTKAKIAQLALSTAMLAVTTHSVAGASSIDPEAVALLRNSLEHVAGMKTFSLLTTSTIEVVLENGQKLQFDNVARATVQRPDKFHAVRLGGLVDQEFFYNGQTLTLQDNGAGYHATAPAPANLDDALDFAREALDIAAPAGDFIYENSFELLMEGVESAMYLGPTYVGDSICDHLAFSAPGHATDWQVWIQQGDNPVPRRIVITSRDIPGAPQFTAHIREWNQTPDIPAGLFDFDAGDSSTEIEFIVVNVGSIE